MKKISIIIPLYHGKEYIKYLLYIASQNYYYIRSIASLEVILVNDSPEEHIDITEQYPFSIKIHENDKNSGIHQSRVNGLLESTGDYITFWDQDDRWSPYFLLSQMDKIDDADVIFCDAIHGHGLHLFNGDSDIEHIIDSRWYISHLMGIISPGQSLIRRSSIPDEWMRYIMHTNYCDDAYLWILMKDRRRKFTVNKECLYVHVEDEHNTSKNWKNNIISLTELNDIVINNDLLSHDNMVLFEKCITDRIKNNSECIHVEEILNFIYDNPLPLKTYLKKYNRISIYGFGNMGILLVELFEQIGVNYSHIYDRQAVSDRWNVERLNNGDDSDLMIVSILIGRENIISWIESVSKAEVISIMDLENCCSSK